MANLKWIDNKLNEQAQGTKAHFQIGKTAMHPNGSQWIASKDAGVYLTAHEGGGVVFFEHFDKIEQAKKRAEELEFAHRVEVKE